LKFDFVTFLETFTDDFTSTLFSTFTSFVAPAKKLSKQGRKSGGVIVLVRNTFLPFIKQIKLDCENVVVLEAKKELFGTDENVFIICTYLNPISSPFYVTSDFGDGISMIEHCLLEILQKHENALFFINGDLNARIGNKVPTRYNLEYDSEREDEDGYEEWAQSGNFEARHSQDIHDNVYGHGLLRLCSCFDLVILNGMCEGDKLGQYTYVSDTGCSVIDYFIISRGLSCLPIRMTVENRIDSKHMPITCYCQCLKTDGHVQQTNNASLSRMIWSDEKSEKFRENILKQDFLTRIESAKCLVYTDIDDAVTKFTNIMTEAASCFIRNTGGKKLFKKEWFDKECLDKRRTTRNALRKYTRSLLYHDRVNYCRLRKEYKKVSRYLVEKEKKHKITKTKELENDINFS
jgi:hypothetical protein